MCRLAVLALMCCLAAPRETESLQLETKPLCTAESASLLKAVGGVGGREGVWGGGGVWNVWASSRS